ncbi:MAG: hypothetical protein EXR99_09670 [Gemmataceae bacterium]|nr:hypothetical protein [Gemmataceae bacterium]
MYGKFRQLLGVLLAGMVGVATAADEGKVVVVIEGLKSVAPAEWKEEPVSNRMRYAQFVLPKEKGDDRNGEVIIFKGLGGSAKANIDRWVGMFKTADGDKIKNPKVKEIKVAGVPSAYLDVNGTYLFKTAPFDPNAKAMAMENYRMLAVHVEGETIYHIRLVGPAKTVAKYAPGFDKWLESFK